MPLEEPAPVLLGGGHVAGHGPALGEGVSLHSGGVVCTLQLGASLNGSILSGEVSLQNAGHVGSSASGILQRDTST